MQRVDEFQLRAVDVIKGECAADIDIDAGSFASSTLTFFIRGPMYADTTDHAVADNANAAAPAARMRGSS